LKQRIKGKSKTKSKEKEEKEKNESAFYIGKMIYRGQEKRELKRENNNTKIIKPNKINQSTKKSKQHQISVPISKQKSTTMKKRTKE